VGPFGNGACGRTNVLARRRRHACRDRCRRTLYVFWLTRAPPPNRLGSPDRTRAGRACDQRREQRPHRPARR
jgi:hypothetical protein